MRFNYYTCGYIKLLDKCPFIGVHVRNSRETGQDFDVPKPFLSATEEATVETPNRLYISCSRHVRNKNQAGFGVFTATT